MNIDQIDPNLECMLIYLASIFLYWRRTYVATNFMKKEGERDESSDMASRQSCCSSCTC